MRTKSWLFPMLMAVVGLGLMACEKAQSPTMPVTPKAHADTVAVAADVHAVAPTAAPTTFVAPADVVSKIFAANPKRPGAGYITWNGVTYRIAGTTAAGGVEYIMQLPGTRYILDGGVLADGSLNEILGPEIDVNDYFQWCTEWHAPDSQ